MAIQYPTKYKDGNQHHIKEVISVSAGATATLILDSVHAPITVTAIPGGGGTAAVSTSTSSLASIVADSGETWVAWPSGTVSAATSDVLNGPVNALLLAATTAAATFEVVA